MGTIISAIVNGALTAVFGFLSSIMEKRGLVRQGQQQQAAAETATAEKTQAAIAQAVADAPQTKDAALQRLRDGTA